MIGKKIKPNALIVGASGFIGSSLSKYLFNRGYNVTAIIGSHGLKYLGGIKRKGFKIYPYKEIKNKFNRLGKFKFIFNLSGYIDVKESFIEPLKYEMNKPVVTIKLIRGCQVEKFINISTANVYDFESSPLNENSLLKPASPYAITQLSADYYTEVLCGYRKIPYLILRLFNPYGAPNTQRGIISTIINSFIIGQTMTLYNPRRRFDFTYIDDIIRAINFCAHRQKGVINIGYGKEVSLFELYSKLSYIFYGIYKEPKIEISDEHKYGVFSDNKKLKKAGFNFKYSLDKGLLRTVKYFKEVKGLKP